VRGAVAPNPSALALSHAGPVDRSPRTRVVLDGERGLGELGALKARAALADAAGVELLGQVLVGRGGEPGLNRKVEPKSELRRKHQHEQEPISSYHEPARHPLGHTAAASSVGHPAAIASRTMQGRSWIITTLV
jgi:hypothetical protein